MNSYLLNDFHQYIDIYHYNLFHKNIIFNFGQNPSVAWSTSS